MIKSAPEPLYTQVPNGGPALNPWDSLSRLAVNDPLIDAATTLESIDHSQSSPETVFAGIGVCTPFGISQTIPFDAVAMILAAENVRRTVGATRSIFLVADRQAVAAGFDVLAVDQAAANAVKTIKATARALGIEDLDVILASSLVEDQTFQAAREALQINAKGDFSYFVEEAADIEYVCRKHGSTVKLGWTVGGQDHRRDEVAFDRYFKSLTSSKASFVYTLAGRALDDRRPKVSPYATTDPSKRVCLIDGECVAAKLATTQPKTQTVRGVRNHLKAVVRAAQQAMNRSPAKPPALPLADAETRAQELIHRIINNKQEGRSPLVPNPV